MSAFPRHRHSVPVPAQPGAPAERIGNKRREAWASLLIATSPLQTVAREAPICCPMTARSTPGCRPPGAHSSLSREPQSNMMSDLGDLGQLLLELAVNEFVDEYFDEYLGRLGLPTGRVPLGLLPLQHAPPRPRPAERVLHSASEHSSTAARRPGQLVPSGAATSRRRVLQVRQAAARGAGGCQPGGGGFGAGAPQTRRQWRPGRSSACR